MVKFLVVLLSAGLLSLAAHSEPQTITFDEFDVTADIETQQVIPGMPLYLYMHVFRHEAQRRKPMDIRMHVPPWIHLLTITDEHGNEVGQRPKEEWYSACSGFMSGHTLKPGESFRKTLIVHQWCNTDLPEGAYTITLNLAHTLFATREPERRTRPNLFKDFSGSLQFPITIQPRDDEAVKARFTSLMALATRPAENPLEDKDKFRAFDTIIHAQGPLAVPFQLALAVESHKEEWSLIYVESRVMELFRYLAHSGNASTAAQLIALASGPELDDEKTARRANSVGVWWYLLWAIREMHVTGDEEITRLTGPFFEPTGVPKLGLGRGYYMDCMGFDEDY